MHILYKLFKFLFRWFWKLFIIVFIVANVLAFFHSRKIFYYDSAASEPKPLKELEGIDRAKAYALGQALPRPESGSTPDTVGLSYTEHDVEIWGGAILKVWAAKQADNRAPVALLVPGYRETKSDLLTEGRFYHSEGFHVVWLDTYGTGESSGSQHTFGIKEHHNIKHAAEFIEEAFPRRNLLVHARGSGTAAVIHALKFDFIQPMGIVLDTPFSRFTNLVRKYFQDLGVPESPSTQLTTFWGWMAGGNNGFNMYPADMVRTVSTPTLVLAGKATDSIPFAESKALYDVMEDLHGPKLGERLRFQTTDAACEDGFLNVDPGNGGSAIRTWLAEIKKGPIPGSRRIDLNPTTPIRFNKPGSGVQNNGLLNRLPHEIGSNTDGSSSTGGQSNDLPLYQP